MTRGRALGGLLGLALAGCGSSASGPPATPTASPAATPPPTLAARDVPYLVSSVKPLTPRSLARELADPSLPARLRGWGFQDAAERSFQGESRRLQTVDSRTLRFSGAGGATAFVSFMRTHLDPLLGSFARISAYGSGGRAGILAAGQECQCHLANPTFLALVARRGTVSWLEINGPAATRHRMAALLARAP